MIDASWIAAHERDPKVRLIEVDVSPSAYDSGHIPGAVFWNAYSDLRDPGLHTDRAWATGVLALTLGTRAGRDARLLRLRCGAGLLADEGARPR